MQRSMSHEQPRVIFLDAVGTLFGVKGSVGEVYRSIAQRFQVDVSAEVLNRAFSESFRAAEAPAFAVMSESELQAKEFAWWMAIASQTFKQAGVFHQFTDFAGFFSELYAHFATAEPWFIYPDVMPALQQWQRDGVQLGILSNFDSRLYSVLHAIDLVSFFSSVTISTEAGFAKPNPQIFQLALKKHHCSPEEAWHIGDRYDEDYQAARAVGLRGIWLRRK